MVILVRERVSVMEVIEVRGRKVDRHADNPRILACLRAARWCTQVLSRLCKPVWLVCRRGKAFVNANHQRAKAGRLDHLLLLRCYCCFCCYC